MDMSALTSQITCMAVLLVGVVACGYDVPTKRIPNVLTLGGALVALVFHGVTDGLPGFGSSLLGWGAGLVVFFPLFALGGMGAGDLKLLACLGAWLGPVDAFRTAIFAAISGGAMALVLVLARGYARKAFANLWLLFAHWRVAGIRPLPELTLEGSRGPRLAYAVPITAGALVTFWLR